MISSKAYSKTTDIDAVGIWAANGEKCNNAKMFLVITENKIVGIAKGKLVAKIADLIDIQQIGNHIKLVLSENETWHMKFDSNNSGNIIGRELYGKNKNISKKQKKLLNIQRCEKI